MQVFPIFQNSLDHNDLHFGALFSERINKVVAKIAENSLF